MLGLTVATLLGTPLATWAGQLLGWRAAFALVGAIGLVGVALAAVFVPRDAPDRNAGPLRELGALLNLQVWLTLAVGAVGFGGMFAVLTYITPTLVKVSGIPLAWVPAVLACFGAGMILGNVVGPRFADRGDGDDFRHDPVERGGAGAVLGRGALGLERRAVRAADRHGFAAVPALQTRLMDVGRDAQTLAAALNHSALNIANAFGAWLGGAAISAGYGWTSTGWVGGAARLGGAGGVRRFGGARQRAAKRAGGGGRRGLTRNELADLRDAIARGRRSSQVRSASIRAGCASARSRPGRRGRQIRRASRRTPARPRRQSI